MRARPRILLETAVECVSRMQTAEPVSINSCSLFEEYDPGSHTVCSATAAENGVAAGGFDRGDDLAGRGGAFDEDELVLEVCFNLVYSCRGVSSEVSARWVSGLLPSRACREVEIDFTQPSQVIGTEKVVCHVECISIESSHVALFRY